MKPKPPQNILQPTFGYSPVLRPWTKDHNVAWAHTIRVATTRWTRKHESDMYWMNYSERRKKLCPRLAMRILMDIFTARSPTNHTRAYRLRRGVLMMVADILSCFVYAFAVVGRGPQWDEESTLSCTCTPDPRCITWDPCIEHVAGPQVGRNEAGSEPCVSCQRQCRKEILRWSWHRG